MVASHHFTRVDTLELKDLIYQRIGHKRAEKYFDQLKRFLSLRLSKGDFDKICLETMGRENISLHNQLIRSIVQNASQAKVPPQKARKVEGLGVKFANGYQRNCLQSLCGDAFAQSPRKCKSPLNRDRKFRDRPSPLGPLGKSPSFTVEETVSRVEEQGPAELRSLYCIPPMGIASVEEGEEVDSIRSWSSITAPYGVSVNMGGARKAIHSGYSYPSFAKTCQISGALPDTRSLRARLQNKLAWEGVDVSLDSANLLNNSLDVYLKRLIEGIAGSRHTDPRSVGRWLNSQTMSTYGMSRGQYVEMATLPTFASMVDFRVAMESNPSILGENWSTQLEKICNYGMQY